MDTGCLCRDGFPLDSSSLPDTHSSQHGQCRCHSNRLDKWSKLCSDCPLCRWGGPPRNLGEYVAIMPKLRSGLTLTFSRFLNIYPWSYDLRSLAITGSIYTFFVYLVGRLTYRRKEQLYKLTERCKGRPSKRYFISLCQSLDLSFPPVCELRKVSLGVALYDGAKDNQT